MPYFLQSPLIIFLTVFGYVPEDLTYLYMKNFNLFSRSTGTSSPSGIDADNIGWFDRALFRAYGADPRLLAKATYKDVTRARIFGALILTVPAFAFCSMAYAASIVVGGGPNVELTSLQTIMVLSIAGLWSYFVYQIDRSLFINIGKAAKGAKAVATRIVMAVFIGVLIAIPLELRILQTDINSLVQGERTELLTKRTEAVTSEADESIIAKMDEIAIMEDKVSDQKVEVRRLATIAQNELDGNPQLPRSQRTKKGPGRIYDIKKAAADQATAVLNGYQEELNTLKSELNNLRAEKRNLIDQTSMQVDEHDGLMIRFRAGHEHFPLSMLFMTLAFLMIELTPILSKLLSPRTMLDDLEKQAEADAYAANGIEVDKEGKVTRFYSADLAAHKAALKHAAALDALNKEAYSNIKVSPNGIHQTG